MSREIPKIETSTKFNFFTSIWIVPFIALVVAGWLAYQYFSQLGPEVRIVFPKNEGLIAGQSVIKYRNVPVGTIKKIELQEHGNGIVVVARMDKGIAPYLNNNSKFWIVKPEVSIGGVSGLDTLLSGIYINMYATKDEESQNHFVGQAHAYRDDSQGQYFVLNTPKGINAVKVGTPIFLKNIRVGQVEYVVLSMDNTSVDIIIYMENDYTPYLRTDSNFWVRSTFEMSFKNYRVDLAVAPITDLIQGAIEFSSLKKGLACEVPDGYIFKLNSNKGEVENTFLGSNEKYVEDFKLYTNESVSKLHIGAPVRYEGFEVGRVKGMNIHYDALTHKMKSEVLVSLTLSVFANSEDTKSTSGKENFSTAIKEGLRAQIIPTDPITGFLYVDLVFTPNDTNKTIVYNQESNIIPTIHHESSDVMASVNTMINKINALPLNTLIESLDKVFKDANNVVLDTQKVVKSVHEPLVDVLSELKSTIKNLNKMTDKKSFNTMPDEINKTLKILTQTLKTTKKVVKGYDNNSLLTHQISQTLNVVTQTSAEMKLFLKMLNRKPTSLIIGDK